MMYPDIYDFTSSNLQDLPHGSVLRLEQGRNFDYETDTELVADEIRSSAEAAGLGVRIHASHLGYILLVLDEASDSRTPVLVG